jgi:NitT/TauT family transport system substrate-binding protein
MTLKTVRFAVLRGVCQTPAYVASEKGFFQAEGLNVTLDVVPTAWLIPHQLATGEREFSIMPWTRVAAAQAEDVPLILVAGSGIEEAAMVIRKGITPADVRKVAVPKEGGIKDLTAMALIESLGWQDAELIRQPSGDGAIISFFGQGSDAASMVEPYATMMEELNVGSVLRRTGDVWKDAPGCSLATTVRLTEEDPELVQAVVNAHVQAVNFVQENPAEAAEIASHYIGINHHFIRNALRHNRPSADAIRNTEAMQNILALMQRLGYIKEIPTNYMNLTFLERAKIPVAV